MQNYFTQNSFSRKISRFSAFLFFAVIVGVIAGCSGGSDSKTAVASATPTTPTTPVIPPVATIQLLASNTQVASTGTNTVDLTAIVLSASKQIISGKTVTFSAGNDSTAFINNISASGVSDANGLVTAKLNVGGDKTNRQITVSATAESVTAKNSVDVTGTTVTISGTTSLALTASTKLTFSVKDSAGTPLQGVPVCVSSNSGNGIAPTSAACTIGTANGTIIGTTNSSGQVTGTVTANVSGPDVITATAAGANATQALTISSATFVLKISNPNPACVGMAASTPEIPLIPDPCNAPTVTANWTDAVTSPITKTVSFSTSRGTIAGGTLTATSSSLLVAGTASVTISSTTAGPAIITASGPGGTPAATLEVIFVATSATKATLQANPGTVAFTTGSPAQSNNSSTITVTVRDANDNLVKNAGVTFNLADTSGGRLTAASGKTDVSGSTSVTYIAGGSQSAQNGVGVTASVTDIGGVSITPVTAATALTVGGQSLLISLGTDGTVGVDPTTNVNLLRYTAIVTDSGGNPVKGASVQFALRPGTYQKGQFVLNASKIWVPSYSTVPACINEDINFNGSLDPGESLVGFPAGITPSLRPGAVASVNTTGITDDKGIAIATIAYPKDHSYWTKVTLEARTTITGNDPPFSATVPLIGPSTDYNDSTKAPPGFDSPYGIGVSCSDTL